MQTFSVLQELKMQPKKSVTSGPPRIECTLTFSPFGRPKCTLFGMP